ncbi:hypothetical protein [Paraburkholderia sp. 32]|uniref:hypothetical protein n=1 Tax=Paraburkholderia sp. 32 TaxID=2991057 RepID=UPI003D23C413
MFEVTPDDIQRLNDTDLRELVALLCEAELAAQGLSTAAVTWGGSQTAADGGLDARVDLAAQRLVEGYIPRPATGFQVKKPDMPRAAILKEMRPNAIIRPVIQELADSAGAYVIVSSQGSTADVALCSRREAMRDALSDAPNSENLHTDFYDRRRVASWVQCHPGLIAWVRQKVGRALKGWRPYGEWSGAGEGTEAEYLLDSKLRVHPGWQQNSPATSVDDAMDTLRDELRSPGSIVRLVGLSGVGKTRFVQALFDARVGERALSPSLAVYTNLSDDPDPQPTAMATNLIARRARAVLIVDNCPPTLHRSLTELCRGPDSTVSVLTVEYDVRDDQPEGTHVVSLDTSSLELIGKLVQRRYPHLSLVDARTIADASGGNARIAVALAETVGQSGSITGLSSDELFERLFWQRHKLDDTLLLAGQACSLVYSFDGENLDGENAALSRIASLVGQTALMLYRHVGELLRRDLVQQRGVWRAVLPHALANRLAARALEDIPYSLLEKTLVESGDEHLVRSFSRRLSYLTSDPKAIEIVRKWLSDGGLLGDVTAFSPLQTAMFKNVAPVDPEATLKALERATYVGQQVAPDVWVENAGLLRSLAYDAPLFGRSVAMLARAAAEGRDSHKAEEVGKSFASLFTIHLSGTHASISQRLSVIERLLKSGEKKPVALGMDALGKILVADYFTSSRHYDFGARSRDFGHSADTVEEVQLWYRAALALIERLALEENALRDELRALVAGNFRGLWAHAGMFDELEQLSRKFADDGFWQDGWAACMRTLSLDGEQLRIDIVTRLRALEEELRPRTLIERVRAVVFEEVSGGLDLEDMCVGQESANEFERLGALARELGVMVASDDNAFAALAPDFLSGGSQAWSFGSGLAAGSADPVATWSRIEGALSRASSQQSNAQVLRGYVAELWKTNRDTAQRILDSAYEHPDLQPVFVQLQTSMQLDERGAARLVGAVRAEMSPISQFSYLKFGGVAAQLPVDALKELLLVIAAVPGGWEVAVEILNMRIFANVSEKRALERGILETAYELMAAATFVSTNRKRLDYELAEIAKSCLASADAAGVAASLAAKLRQAGVNHVIDWSGHADLLCVLLEFHAITVLDALFDGLEEDRWVDTFEFLVGHRRNPLDVVPPQVLVEWCDAAPATRYKIAASLVRFSSRAEASGQFVWSEQAIALLEGVKDKRAVLEAFIARLRPRSCSGSRAVLIEANTQLLDTFELHLLPEMRSYASAEKARLLEDAARERAWEAEHDRQRDERFEP